MVPQSATVKKSRILCFLEIFCTHVFKNGFSNNRTYFIALLNADFQIPLFGQLTSTNSCLLKCSILVRINALKYNVGKQFRWSRYSDNQDSNYWTVFGLLNVDCSCEKEFAQINRGTGNIQIFFIVRYEYKYHGLG